MGLRGPGACAVIYYTVLVLLNLQDNSDSTPRHPSTEKSLESSTSTPISLPSKNKRIQRSNDITESMNPMIQIRQEGIGFVVIIMERKNKKIHLKKANPNQSRHGNLEQKSSSTLV